MARIHVRCRVRIFLDVPLTQTWDESCTVRQIEEQATASVIGSLKKTKLVAPDLGHADVIGEPTVEVVLARIIA